MAGDRLDVAKLVAELFTPESFERRVGHNCPDIAIDGNQPRRARPRDALRNAAERWLSHGLHEAKNVSD
jgi:hypothetical protein